MRPSTRKFAWLPKEINGIRKWLKYYRKRKTSNGVLLRWESSRERK